MTSRVLLPSVVAAVVLAAAWWLLASRPDVGAPAAAEVAVAEGLRLVGRPTTRGRAEPAVAVAGGSATIQGRLEGPDGAPVGGVGISAWAVVYDPAPWALREILDRAFAPTVRPAATARTRTAADGSFRIPGVPDGSWAVVASPPSPWAATSARVMTPSYPACTVRLRLHTGLAMGGVVAAGGDVPFLVAASHAEFRTDALIAVPPSPLPSTFPPDLRPCAHPTVDLALGGTFGVLLPAERGRVIASWPGWGGVERVTGLPATDLRLAPVVTPGAAVVGRVTGFAGAPLVRARLLLISAGASGDICWRVARTGADGAYRIQGLPAGALQRLVADAPGHAARALSGPVMLHGGAARVLDITLARGAGVRGRVLDMQGRPVAEASVTIDGRSWRHETRSAQTGEWAVEGMPAGEVRLSAGSADGRTDREVEVLLVEGEEATGLDLTLRAGATLHGRVWQDGTPTAGAIVEASPWRPFEGRWYDDSPTGVRLTAETDADGRFRLPGLPAGREWQLEARAPGCRSPSLGPLRTSARQEEQEVVLQLRPAAKVSGQVLDPGGRPCAGAWVQLLPSHATRADEKGRFTFEDLPAGRFMPYVRDVEMGHPFEGPRPGGVIGVAGRRDVEEVHPLELAWGARVDDLVVVGPTQPEAHRPRVPRPRPSWRLRGRVVDPDGMPVPMAELCLSNPKWSHSIPVFGGLFDAEVSGWFDRIDRLDVRGAFDSAGAPLVLPGGPLKALLLSQEELVLRLERLTLFDLVGRVIGPDERPVGGVVVHVKPGGEPARTDRAGNFLIRSTAPGPWELTVPRPGAGFREVPPVPVASAEAPVLFVLQRAASIGGRVEGPDREPLAGVRVYASGHGAYASDLTAADGSFHLDGLPPGESVALEVRPGGARPWLPMRAPHVFAGTEGLLIVLYPGAHVTGELLDESGTPIRLGSVELRAGEERVAWQLLQGDTNRWCLGPVRPGDYTLVYRPRRDRGAGDEALPPPSLEFQVQVPSSDLQVVVKGPIIR